MKTGVLLLGQSVPMGDTERHSVVRLGVTSAVVACYALYSAWVKIGKVKFCSYIAIRASANATNSTVAYTQFLFCFVPFTFQFQVL